MLQTTAFRLLALLFVLFFASPVTAQIDFEAATYSEGDAVFDDHWNDPCGVRFYLDDDTTKHPVIAEVGPPMTAFQGVNTNSPACGVNNNNQSDMPHQGEGVGCKFLTDDGIVFSNAPSGVLWIEYRNMTDKASGDLLDIDQQEKWEITVLDAGKNPIQTRTLAGPQVQGGMFAIDDLGNQTGNGRASRWIFDFQGMQFFKYITIEYKGTSNNVGLAFDNFNACGTGQATCCGGTNLVANGDFEQLVPFNSHYAPVLPNGPNSVLPGQYTIGDAADGIAISPQWFYAGANGCDLGDNVLLVNGRTMGTSAARIWRTTITYTPGETYKLCAFFKNLPQCAFDVKPRVAFAIGNAVPTNWMTINTDPTNPCDWQEYSIVIPTTGTGGPTTAPLALYLDETGIGDGNDLAVDDISLELLPAVNTNFAAFTLTNTPVDPNTQTYNAVATPTSPLPGNNCMYQWSICRLDNVGNCLPGTEVHLPSQWDNANPNSFIGYTGGNVLSGNSPGEFKEKEVYQVTLTVNCGECTAPASVSHTFSLVDDVLVIDGEPGEGNDDDHPGLRGSRPAGSAEMQLYPNPSTGKVFLERPLADRRAANLTVMSPKGQVVLRNALDPRETQVEIDLHGMANGIYLMQYESGGKIRSYRIVLQSE